MTLHKKAEEVAEKVYQGWCEIDTPKEQLHKRIVSEIVAALVAFAEAQVKEAIANTAIEMTQGITKIMDLAIADDIKRLKKEARNTALDEAAGKIEASVNLPGIENPSEGFINSRLQCIHDAEICRTLKSKAETSDNESSEVK